MCVLVFGWQRQLTDHHSLPFPWILSLHRRWCPSASHHHVSFLSLLAYLLLSTSVSFPLAGCANGATRLSPFQCSVSGPHIGLAIGRVRPSGHPRPAVGGSVPNGGFWALGCPLAGSLHQRGHKTTFRLSIPTLSPPCGEPIMPPPPPCVRGGCIVSPFPCVAWVPSGMVCNGWHKVTGKGGLFSRVARVPGSMVGGGWQN